MSFKMRTTKPGKDNKYYIRKANGGYSNAIAGNPTDSECNVLANCVGYAYGRFNEIGGYGCCKYLAPVNAENFITYKGSCVVGQTPKLGACMVWQRGATLSGSDGAGHVAIVEKVISPTEVITSESGYGSSKPFWTQTRKKGSGNWGANSSYKFLGFIYNPAVKDGETVAEAPQSDKATGYTAASFNVGDIVEFTGGTHYSSANARSGAAVKPSLAKVTSKYASGAHPIHLRAVNENGKYISGVYGWVDLNTIAKFANKKSVDEIAREVIAGKWKTGLSRISALKAAGYDASAVQQRVNEIMRVNAQISKRY